MIGSLPVEKGSYVLWLALEDAIQVPVGRLGVVTFPRGDYFYLGSARGSGGLRGRLQHHLKASNHPHWHIDHFRPATIIRGVFYAMSGEPLECIWSQALAEVVGAVNPVPGFGASDCQKGCSAHLVCFPKGIAREGVLSILKKDEEGYPVLFMDIFEDK
ncbi:MAG: GIY-YIG nuclease family protein [Anaerolineales bacterium]|nr:MAG: GIY-YIG nuclease family protein [Anaerolineales bacterium]